MAQSPFATRPDWNLPGLPSPVPMPEGSSITAWLGPTNRGKTHRAIERMLAQRGVAVPWRSMGAARRLLRATTHLLLPGVRRGW